MGTDKEGLFWVMCSNVINITKYYIQAKGIVKISSKIAVFNTYSAAKQADILVYKTDRIKMQVIKHWHNRIQKRSQGQKFLQRITEDYFRWHLWNVIMDLMG